MSYSDTLRFAAARLLSSGRRIVTHHRLANIIELELSKLSEQHCQFGLNSIIDQALCTCVEQIMKWLSGLNSLWRDLWGQT